MSKVKQKSKDKVKVPPMPKAPKAPKAKAAKAKRVKGPAVPKMPKAKVAKVRRVKNPRSAILHTRVVPGFARVVKAKANAMGITVSEFIANVLEQSLS